MANIEKLNKQLEKTSPNEVGTYKFYDLDVVVPYVFEQLSEGRTLTDICEEDDVPSVFHTLTMINSRKLWAQQYKRMRQIRAEVEYEKSLQDIESVPNDWKGLKVKHDIRKWWIEKAYQENIGKDEKETETEKNRLIGIDLTPEALEKLKEIAEELEEKEVDSSE